MTNKEMSSNFTKLPVIEMLFTLNNLQHLSQLK
jgi:hypothetical protein